MIGTIPEMRAFAHEMTVSVWTLAAIGALYESGLVAHLSEPRTLDDLAARCPGIAKAPLAQCLRVAAAVGVIAVDGDRYQLAEGAKPFAEEPLRSVLRGDIRSQLMQALAFLDSSSTNTPTAGWRHTDRAILQAQGDASGTFPLMFKANLIGGLGDLAARMERPGARFLDVGVGVASLTIAMCRAWPNLRVVGLDAADAPLALARENVAAAKLDDRVELRKGFVQDLTDAGSFDLAWLPTVFLGSAALIKTAIERVRASLSEGGWILVPNIGANGTEHQQAVGALLTELWGGPAISIAELEGFLKEAGFTTVRTMAGPPWAPALVAAQR